MGPDCCADFTGCPELNKLPCFLERMEDAVRNGTCEEASTDPHLTLFELTAVLNACLASQDQGN